MKEYILLLLLCVGKGQSMFFERGPILLSPLSPQEIIKNIPSLEGLKKMSLSKIISLHALVFLLTRPKIKDILQERKNSLPFPLTTPLFFKKIQEKNDEKMWGAKYRITYETLKNLRRETVRIKSEMKAPCWKNLFSCFIQHRTINEKELQALIKKEIHNLIKKNDSIKAVYTLQEEEIEEFWKDLEKEEEKIDKNTIFIDPSLYTVLFPLFTYEKREGEGRAELRHEWKKWIALDFIYEKNEELEKKGLITQWNEFRTQSFSSKQKEEQVVLDSALGFMGKYNDFLLYLREKKLQLICPYRTGYIPNKEIHAFLEHTLDEKKFQYNSRSLSQKKQSNSLEIDEIKISYDSQRLYSSLVQVCNSLFKDVEA